MVYIIEQSSDILRFVFRLAAIKSKFGNDVRLFFYFCFADNTGER